jgi:hypothetical protein
MSSMSRDLAREIGRERTARARHRRLVDEVTRASRAERRTKRAATGGWWRRRGVPVSDQPALTAAPAPRPEDVTEALANVLAGVAERLAEHGTATDRFALQAVHDATRWSAPGAAAALVDWDAPEVARLRAFGELHGVAMSVLGPEDQAWLLDRLRGGSAQEHSGRVA